MRKAIEQLDKEIKRVRNGYELTQFGEGYIEGIEISKEIIQKNIDNLVVAGKTYFVIVYEDGNEFQPCIREMKLVEKIPAKWGGYRYRFSFDLEAVNRFSRCDLEIRKPDQLRERVFLDERQAERELRKRLKGSKK